MTTFSMFLFAPAAVHGAACTGTYDAATSTWETIAQNSACYCGSPPNDSANNCGSATGNTCIDKVDGGKTCKLMAKCATTDGSAAADYCECLNTAGTLDTAGGDSICGPEGYCYSSDETAVSATKCSNIMSTKMPSVPKYGTAGSYVVGGQMAKCGDKYCTSGQYCSAITTAGVGTCTATTGVVIGIDNDAGGAAQAAGGLDNMICANVAQGAQCGAGAHSATKLYCTAATATTAATAATQTPNKWDVITNAKTDFCVANSDLAAPTAAKISTGLGGKKFYVYGAPLVTSARITAATSNACTAYKVLGPNEYCYAAGALTAADSGTAIYCSGGTFFLGTTVSTSLDCATDAKLQGVVPTYCKVAGSITASAGTAASGAGATGDSVAPKLCNVHAQTTAGEGCACAPNAGDLDEVQGGERACPDNSYCYAQGKEKGQTLQGVNTCMSSAAKQCYENAGSASADSTLTSANMNGTVFTAAHGATTGLGEACFCGDKICGAGRACISANTTGWSGIAADGACGAATYAASHQCLSAAIDHCPGANGTVGLDVFSAGRADPWKITADGVNKACYCDAGETTICGAGRYCLNNTASGFTGSAECLSDVLQHCTNYTGFTGADEACTCSDSLTCAQGQFCVNGTHFTDDSKPAECLAAQIAPCVNWTTALGANTNACTCGKDVCAAGQSCDSNTTCKADNTPAPTGESAAGYEKPAIAFLTVVAIAFSALY